MPVAVAGLLTALYVLFCSIGLSGGQAVEALSNMGTISPTSIVGTVSEFEDKYDVHVDEVAWSAVDNCVMQIDPSAMGTAVDPIAVLKAVHDLTPDICQLLYAAKSNVDTDFPIVTIDGWENTFYIKDVGNNKKTLAWSAVNNETGWTSEGDLTGYLQVNYDNGSEYLYRWLLSWSWPASSWSTSDVRADRIGNISVNGDVIIVDTWYSNVYWPLYLKQNYAGSLAEIPAVAEGENYVGDYAIDDLGNIVVDGQTISPNADGTYTIDGVSVYPTLNHLNIANLGDSITETTNNYYSTDVDLETTNGLLGAISNTLTAIKIKLSNLFSVPVSDLKDFKQICEEKLGIATLKSTANTAYATVFATSLFDSGGNFIFPHFGSDTFNYRVPVPHFVISAFGYSTDLYDLFLPNDDLFTTCRNVLGTIFTLFFLINLFKKIGASFGEGNV